MKKKLVPTVILITFILTGNLIAQTIDSLKIIPTIPNTNDTVKVIGYVTYPNSPCYLINSSINFIDSTIKLTVSHYDSINVWPAVCNSTDTLSVGVLNNGTYEVNYHLVSDTAPQTTYDIDTIFFTVQQASGISPVYFSDQIIIVYPNPATNEITLNLKTCLTSSKEIYIYSAFGQKIKTIRTNMNKINIYISNLTEGIYYIKITDGQGKRWTKKLIKTHHNSKYR